MFPKTVYKNVLTDSVDFLNAFSKRSNGLVNAFNGQGKISNVLQKIMLCRFSERLVKTLNTSQSF